MGSTLGLSVKVLSILGSWARRGEEVGGLSQVGNGGPPSWIGEWTGPQVGHTFPMQMMNKVGAVGTRHSLCTLRG